MNNKDLNNYLRILITTSDPDTILDGTEGKIKNIIGDILEEISIFVEEILRRFGHHLDHNEDINNLLTIQETLNLFISRQSRFKSKILPITQAILDIFYQYVHKSYVETDEKGGK